MAKTNKRDVESHFLTDVETLDKATEVYSYWGLSLSDAINVFLIKSIEIGGLPFEMRSKPASSKTSPTADCETPEQEDDNRKDAKQTAEELIEAINGERGQLEGRANANRNPSETIGGNTDRYAALVLTETEEQAGAYSEAEALLLSSLLCLLKDWYPHDCSPRSVPLLLSMTNVWEIDSDYRSPLDLVFNEIKTGAYYKANPNFEKGSDRPRLLHVISNMSRKSAEDPFEINCGIRKGFDTEEDDSLKFYTCFKALPSQEQARAITALSYRFAVMGLKAKS